MEKERAVETFSHSIAAAIHGGLAHRRMTVNELKEQITDWDATLVDSILAGVEPDKIKINHLADLGFILGLDLQAQLHAIPVPKKEADQKSA